MGTINGRSLAEVRRYDLFKLAVALALFVNWIFFCDGGLVLPDQADEQLVLYESALPPVAADQLAQQPLSLRFAWHADGLRIEGEVPDAGARAALFDAAALALGARERVDDALRESPRASVAPWLARLDEFVAANRPLRDGLVIEVRGRNVVLQGEVDDEVEKQTREHRIVRFFGPRFVIESHLTVKPLPIVSAPGALGPVAAGQEGGAPPVAGDAGSAAAPASPGGPAGAAGAAASPPPVVYGRPGDEPPAPPLPPLPVPVSLFFAEGSAQLPAGAGARLAEVIRFVRTQPGTRVVVSGYHSRSGSQAVNIRLAKARAVAVRERLARLGVPRARIVLDKPVDTLGGFDDARARRVDVSVVR